MKRSVLFLGMVIILSSISAQTRQQTYTEAFDNAFRNISRTDATTGVLYDRVVPFANLVNFNSNVEVAVDTSSFRHFIQSYSELYRASFDARA